MNARKQLSKDVERKVKRMKKADKERHTVFAHTIFLTTLGFVLVLPVILGAYLGRWLDTRMEDGYSMRWTLSLLLLGVVVGAVNVCLLVREH